MCIFVAHTDLYQGVGNIMEKKYERLTKGIVYPLMDKYYESGDLPSTFYWREGLSECQFYTWRQRYLRDHPTDLDGELCQHAVFADQTLLARIYVQFGRFVGLLSEPYVDGYAQGFRRAVRRGSSGYGARSDERRGVSSTIPVVLV